MDYNLIKRPVICFAVGFFAISTIIISGCTGDRIKVKYEKDGRPGYSEIGKEHKKGGPPPHAPAHGYRAKHKYRYYPSRYVYYDTGRRLYFYLSGDNWEVGASLPSHIRVGLGDSVSLELDTDRPYIHHKEHVKKYPPGQLKKKKKDKWG